MRLVFAGTPGVAAVSLQALLDSRHEVLAVITRPDAPAGRGRGMMRSEVGQLADAAGIETLTPTSARDGDFLERLRELAPDCCPVVAYGNLLPAPALAIPARGWVNLHFSLLPAYRGAAPVQAAIAHGDAVTGVTTFLLDEGMDTGPILKQRSEPIRAQDTTGDLLARLAVSGAELLVTTMDEWESDALSPLAQSTEGASLAPKVHAEEARIDWTKPVHEIDCLIRSCTPDPGAWTTYEDSRIKVGPVSALPERIPAGQLVISKRAVVVGAGDASVELGWVQAPGKRAMAAADWARGLRNAGCFA